MLLESTRNVSDILSDINDILKEYNVEKMESIIPQRLLAGIVMTDKVDVLRDFLEGHPVFLSEVDPNYLEPTMGWKSPFESDEPYDKDVNLLFKIEE